MKTRTCPVCGNEFVHNSGNQKYCSEKCSRNAERNKKVSSGKPKERAELNRRTDSDVPNLYAFKCASCGWGLENNEGPFVSKSGRLSFTNGCEVHHIIPVEEGGTSDLRNCILLCPNCHKKAHFGILDREYLFSLVKTDLVIYQPYVEKGSLLGFFNEYKDACIEAEKTTKYMVNIEISERDALVVSHATKTLLKMFNDNTMKDGLINEKSMLIRASEEFDKSLGNSTVRKVHVREEG